MQNKFDPDAFQVITIHTPEFEHERKIPLLQERIKKLNVTYPVLVDNDRKYWKAIGNDGWPSFYIIDKSGQIRFIYLGETHRYFAQARNIEKNISRLLKE